MATRSTRPLVAASSAPTDWVTDVTGMSRANPSPSVPLTSPATLLAMTTADAPAVYAFCALVAKVQPPRGTSATPPTGNPVRSAASQPGVASVGDPGSAVTAAVTSPPPE